MWGVGRVLQTHFHGGGHDVLTPHHQDLPHPRDSQGHVHLPAPSEVERVEGHLSGRFTDRLQQKGYARVTNEFQFALMECMHKVDKRYFLIIFIMSVIRIC